MDGVTLVTPKLPVAQAALAQSWMPASTLKVVGVVALVLALVAAVYVYLMHRALPQADAAAAPLPIARPVIAKPPAPSAPPMPVQPQPLQVPAPASALTLGSPATATATPMVVKPAPTSSTEAPVADTISAPLPTARPVIANPPAPPASALVQLQPTPAPTEPAAASVAQARKPTKELAQQRWKNAVRKIKSQGDFQNQLIKNTDHIIAFRMRAILNFLIGLQLSDVQHLKQITEKLKIFVEPIKFHHPDLLLRKLHAMYHNPNERAKRQIDALLNASKFFNPFNFQAKQRLLEELYPVVCGTTTDDGRAREKVTIKNFAYGTIEEFEASLKRFLATKTVEKFEAATSAPKEAPAPIS